MMSIWRDEVSTYPAGKDSTLRLHKEIKFHGNKAGQFSMYYFFRFVRIFLVFLWTHTLSYAYKITYYFTKKYRCAYP